MKKYQLTCYFKKKSQKTQKTKHKKKTEQNTGTWWFWFYSSESFKIGKKHFFQLVKQYRDTNIQDNVFSHTLGADSLEAVQKLYDEFVHENIDDEKEKDKITKNSINSDNGRPSFRRQLDQKKKNYLHFYFDVR